MSNFDKAVAKVLIHEGGYVWNPLDTGGETNLGITRKTYEKYIGRTAGPNEMKNLTKGNAIAIYKSLYWDKVKADEINNYGIAFALFDQAVNRGPRNATIQAQKALGIFPDGIIDSEMVRHLNNIPSSVFLPKFLDESREAYRRIVRNNPSQSVFLSGWLKRVRSIEAYVYPYLEEVISMADVTVNFPIGKAVGFVAVAGLLSTATILAMRRGLLPFGGR